MHTMQSLMLFSPLPTFVKNHYHVIVVDPDGICLRVTYPYLSSSHPEAKLGPLDSEAGYSTTRLLARALNPWTHYCL